MASKHINERDHVRILRQALKDPVDDVRLLAYAMLDEKEKKISERINRHQQQLKNIDSENSLPVALRLAQDYWEMAYLGLAQGGVRTHFLHRAKDLLLPLVEHKADAIASRLLGRIYLALEQWDEAEDHLLLALDLGIEPQQVLPYLAEAAFHRRQFEKVKDYLAYYAESSVIHPSFSSVVKFWLEDAHAAH
jgi:tetratricopeptide (TPR) repeat protein